jgi:DNA-binding MarR family transcriptional regulator
VYNLCNLRKLFVHLRHFEEKLKEVSGLTLNEALCLCQIADAEAVVSELCTELEISASRVSRILNSLENKNFIKRSIANNDRRTISIEITKEGRDAVKKLHLCDTPLSNELKMAIGAMAEGDKQ